LIQFALLYDPLLCPILLLYILIPPMSVSDGSSGSSSSSQPDRVGGDTIADMDVFITAGKMAKFLAEEVKTNAGRRKVLSQLAGFYGFKMVPVNAISQGSNQIINHLSGLRLNQGGGGKSNNSSNGPKEKYSKVSKKGQAPPKAVKRHPKYLEMSTEHQTLIQKLKLLTKDTDEHKANLLRVRELERAMTAFKNSHGREAINPSGTVEDVPDGNHPSGAASAVATTEQ